MSRVVDRVGEENIASNGMKMKIIAYRGCNDVDIQFEDGTVVKNKSYKMFKEGYIKNPTFLVSKERIGEISIATNGMKMKILAYRNTNDIDVQFEDGTIVCNKTYYSFKRGHIANPLFSRVGEVSTAYNGMKMKLIEYRSCNDIDVQFENGVVVKNRTYGSFKKGEIGLENSVLRVGEKTIANNGMEIKIIEYRSCNDIDVQFENGVIVKNKTYSCFKSGEIGLPKDYNKRVGEINTANNGIKIRIIEYRSFFDIDLQFEDGTIVTNKSYDSFKKGTVKHPYFVLSNNNNTFYKFNNIRKAYKQGKEVNYFCKDERGNSHILTPQQMLEKSGIKSLF
mgnify:CR=1 FL=1